MRRIPAILASGAAIAVVAALAGGSAAGPASAHSCATPSFLAIDKPAVITVGVAAEDVAVDGVTIIVPRQLKLTGADPAEGWTLTRTAAAAEYLGGQVEPYGCTYFSLRGTPVERGAYVLPLKVHFVDGTARTFTSKELGALDSGHIIFAGTDPEDAANDLPRGSNNTAQTAIIVAFAIVGVGIAFFAVRRALRPPADHG